MPGNKKMRSTFSADRTHGLRNALAQNIAAARPHPQPRAQRQMLARAVPRGR